MATSEGVSVGRARQLALAALVLLATAGLLGLASGRPTTTQLVAWNVPRDGSYDLFLRCSGPGLARVDDETVLRRVEGEPNRVKRSLHLQAGLHFVEAECTSRPPYPGLKLTWAEAGQEAAAFGPDESTSLRPARRLALVRLLVVLVSLALWLRAWRAGLGLPPRVARVARWIAGSAPVWILLYAGALRFEALVERHWLEAAPGWAREAADAVGHLRPRALAWEPKEGGYGGDPHEFLRLAAAPRGFYDPHHREPLFVFAGKAGLALVHGQAVGISVASAFFSLASIGLVYVLGARVFSRAVGVLAAALLAVQRDAIELGVSGYRDDAFVCLVLLFAWALVRFGERPGFWRAVVVGLAAGAASLTRITSLSCTLPALVWALLAAPPDRRRDHLRWSLVVLITVAAVLGPFLLACTIGYGDPLYSISIHTAFYEDKSRPGADDAPVRGVLEYLTLSQRPWAMADTFFNGMTSHPFEAKWRGFDPWSAGLGPLLAAAALCGLWCWLLSRPGRFMLVVLFAASLPFAFTWEIWREWRLTFVALPFYLLAAAFAMHAAIAAIADPRETWRRLRPTAADRVSSGLIGAVAVAALAGTHLLPPWLYGQRVAETLAAGQEVSLEVGERGRRFFGAGWAEPVGLEARAYRPALDTGAELLVPLEPGARYLLSVDLVPMPSPASATQPIEVRVNGAVVGSVRPRADQRLVVPTGLVRDGLDRLELRGATGGRFAVFGVRLSVLDQEPIGD